jgi:hypothetical protein
MSEGARLKEGGQDNVSQMINLADVQLEVGHAQAALDVLAGFGDRPVAPYGEMLLRSLRVCALSLLGRQAEGADALAYLAAHERDNPGAREDALLCAGDADGAAALFVRRLRDPLQRDEAFLALTPFDPPASVPAVFAEMSRRRQAVKARPDVQAAIAEVGGLPPVHLTYTDF